jgi:hypothetical protein
MSVPEPKAAFGRVPCPVAEAPTAGHPTASQSLEAGSPRLTRIPFLFFEQPPLKFLWHAVEPITHAGHVDNAASARCVCRFLEVLATGAQPNIAPRRRGGMCHSPRPDHAACPRLLDGVDAGLDSDLVGELSTVPTICARRSSSAKVRHARYSNPRVVAPWLQPYVLAAAAPGRLAQPLAAEQISLKAVQWLGASAVGHRVLHRVGGTAAETWRRRWWKRGA